MVLDKYRPFAEKLLIPVAKRLGNLNPDVITWLALVFAILTGYFFYLGIIELLLLASLFVFLSGFFDALDGALARVSKRASKRGDFLDHVLDRYADVFIIGGIMLSPFCRDFLGFLAIIGVLLTSYMGTQSHAILGKRYYGGHLGRATRLVILIIAPLIQYFILYLGIEMPYGITFLEWVMIYFAIVGNLTALQRGLLTWRSA